MPAPLILVVDSRVRVLAPALPEAAAAELKALHTYKNPKHFDLRRMGYWPGKEHPPTETTWGQSPAGLTFPRGGLAKVVGCLRRHGFEPAVEDRRTPGGGLPPRERLTYRVRLYPYQEELLERALQRETCILKAPTGSGKTCVGLAFAARVGVPTLVVVPNRALFDQWLARAEKDFGLRPQDLGVVQGKTARLRPITIAMQKTLALRGLPAAAGRYFGAVVCDEVQLFAAATFVRVTDALPARYRVGISADHRRKDRKEYLVYDLFGEVAAEVKRDALVKSGHVLDVEVRVVPTDFRADWYGLEEETDYLRQEPETTGEYPKPNISSISGITQGLPTVSETNPPEAKELNFDRLLREMGADDTRNALVERVLEGERGGPPVLVMSHRREHCRELDRRLVGRGYRTGFLIGSQDYAAEFRDTRERLLAGRLDVAVGTFQAVGYGVDLPRVEAGVCATPVAGNEYFFSQVRGRLCRTAEGKGGARLYYLWDRHVYPAHIRNICAWNKNVSVWRGGEWLAAEQYLVESGIKKKARRGSGATPKEARGMKKRSEVQHEFAVTKEPPAAPAGAPHPPPPSPDPAPLPAGFVECFHCQLKQQGAGRVMCLKCGAPLHPAKEWSGTTKDLEPKREPTFHPVPSPSPLSEQRVPPGVEVPPFMAPTPPSAGPTADQVRGYRPGPARTPDGLAPADPPFAKCDFTVEHGKETYHYRDNFFAVGPFTLHVQGANVCDVERDVRQALLALERVAHEDYERKSKAFFARLGDVVARGAQQSGGAR